MKTVVLKVSIEVPLEEDVQNVQLEIERIFNFNGYCDKSKVEIQDIRVSASAQFHGVTQ